MPRFRIDSIADLVRQLKFTPHDTRLAQLDATERLLYDIDPAKAYPFDFVVFRITGYHPRKVAADLLTGLALQHDLGLLIEQVSATLDLRVAALRDPVLSIDDVAERFNVTSKTIQRWRRRGLAARRFIFADGKRRVGFLLASVERFIAAQSTQIASTANLTPLSEMERQQIVRGARRLAGMCTTDALCRRVGRRFNRSPLTILHLLRKHDTDNPCDAVLPHARAPLTQADRARVVRGVRHGTRLAELARRMALPRALIYGVVLDERLARLNRRKLNFIDDPLYHQHEAGGVIDAIVEQEELAPPAGAEAARIPADLPPYLQELYRTPLLSPARERALFLKFNFHKYQFVTARRRLDPELARSRDLGILERHLRRVTDVKNQIVRANLRLVVSVARKHMRPGLSLMELVSDGNLTLMRAVESFDPHKGTRFSTYATLALMKGFARSVPLMLAGRSVASLDRQTLESLPDARSASNRLLVAREELARLLETLDERERHALLAHYGLSDPSELGLSRRRLRQIGRSALAKLRAAAHTSAH